MPAVYQGPVAYINGRRAYKGKKKVTKKKKKSTKKKRKSPARRIRHRNGKTTSYAQTSGGAFLPYTDVGTSNGTIGVERVITGRARNINSRSRNGRTIVARPYTSVTEVQPGISEVQPGDSVSMVSNWNPYATPMSHPHKRRRMIISDSMNDAMSIDSPLTGIQTMTGVGDYYLQDGESGKYEHTPFASVGEKIGNFFFGDWGRKLGWAGGHLIGRIFGSGDYVTSGGVDYNCLLNSKDVPQFASSGMQNLVCHREYIQDIVTSATPGNFNLNSFTINPGLNGTFPWLSTVAQNYEEYRIHGMVFEFKSTSADALNSTNTALGTVILATEYNVLSPNFTSKQSMENYEFAVSARPSVNQMHPIECAKALSTAQSQGLYVRTGAITSGDPRWYDLANFQIATVGFQGASVNVGELWVTYMIEFLKPKLPTTAGGDVGSAHIQIGSVQNGSTPFGGNGSVLVIKNGNLGASTDLSKTLTFNAIAGCQYIITMHWSGTAATVSAPTFSFTNASSTSYFYGPSSGKAAPQGSVASVTEYEISQIITASSSAGSSPVVTMTLGTGGTVPTNAALDIFILQLDNSVNA